MSKQSKTDKPADAPKEFGLKPIEQNLLGAMQARHQQAIFDVCTFIATERLAVQVTPLTVFAVENGKLYVSEREMTPEEQAAYEQQKAANAAANAPKIEAA